MTALLPDFSERLALERRGRLAAERLLQQKQRELFAANEKLALHARALSEQIVEQRHVTRAALSETETLKGQNSRYLTELNNAHTKAVLAERRMLDSIHTIADGFAVFDADLRLVVANPAWCDAFSEGGVAPGMPYVDILEGAADQGLIDLGDAAPDDWVAMMLNRWQASQIDPLELQLSNGNWLRLVDRRARDGDMVCLAQDITAQMRIWAAVEAIPDGFVLYDRDDRLIACNERYRDIYPLSAPAMQPGASFEDILRYGLDRGQHPDAVGREEEWLEERLEAHFDDPSGSEQQTAEGRWLRVIDQPTPDGGRVGLRVDITPMKDQQAALEEARLAAEAANRAKSAFLANMSHEIRTPMNGIVGMAELLTDTTLTEEQKLFADTIRSSGEALLVIINDILDYSKIEAQRLTLHPEPFDLERVIHEVAILLQPRAHSGGLDLLIDYDLFLPTRFIGDAGRLRQVLINLVGNAVKFTESGHVVIRVMGVESEGTCQVHVTVEDTGIGIAKDQLSRIFGEFDQVESDRNRKFEGTGLGLSITRRLIELMEGEVWVDSDPGKGSVFGFRLTLPIAESRETQPSSIRFRHAIIVDDQQINRTILERQLVSVGLQVTPCRNGTEALAALALNSGADVILADQSLPDMSGETLALRAQSHALPVLLFSAVPLAGATLPEGVAGLLQKPALRADVLHRLVALGQKPAPTLLAPVRTAGPNRQMRVLAAEDNRTNQLVFRKMVKDLPIDLTFANNGREAVDLYHSLAPDLIFMDISMPEMDGKEASQAIRAAEALAAKGAHTPIIALTAHAMPGDEVAILAAGIDRYLTKPLRRATITDALAEFCPPDATPISDP